MTSLAGADLATLEVLADRLRGVSAVLHDADDALDRGSRATWRWRGPASDHFAAALSGVWRRVRPVPPAFEQAAAALLTYRAVVEEAQFLLRRAAGLRNEAARLTAPAPLVGPDPAEALRWQAQQLERRAQLEHEDAAARAATAVRAATGLLPRAERGTGWSRFTTDLVTGSLQQVTELAEFALLAARAGRGDGQAREEVWSAAKGAWRVWEPAVQAWHDVRDGRYGLAASGALGMAFVRRPRLVTDREVAHGEALQEARRQALRERIPLREPRPLRVGDLSAPLFVQEAMGGHAIREHVAKSDAYLRWRADQKGLASSFSDAHTAQMAIRTVLEAEPEEVLRAWSLPVGSTMAITGDVGSVVGAGYRRGQEAMLTSTAVKVVLKRRDTDLIVLTAHPDFP